MLSGDVRSASISFHLATASASGEGKEPEQECGREIRLAEFLVRTQRHALAEARIAPILAKCERFELNGYAAWCRWLLSQCAIEAKDGEKAGRELRRAGPVLRKGQLLFWFARLSVTSGYFSLLHGKSDEAIACAEESLGLAGPRAMRLVHADALVLRGRARLIGARTDYAIRALDDVAEALRISRSCGYAWAERDALMLRTDIHVAFKSRGILEAMRAESDLFAKNLVLSDADFSAAESKASGLLADVSS